MADSGGRVVTDITPAYRLGEARPMTRTVLACLLSALVVLASCTTMSRGTSEEIYFNSNPIGASFALSTGASCVAPCHIKLDRDTAVQVAITKEGCQPQAAGTWQTGQFDYDTGAVYDLLPNPLNVTLTCQAGSP
jgi:hypothetical protein